MATGIKDKVAILGMGCSKFGERWDADAEDLIVEAYEECLNDAGVDTSQIDAAVSTAIEEVHAEIWSPLSMALRLPNIPVTRVENYCASGTESFRGAVYAVASVPPISLCVSKIERHRLRRITATKPGRRQFHVLGKRFGAGQLCTACDCLLRQTRCRDGRDQACNGADFREKS